MRGRGEGVRSQVTGTFRSASHLFVDASQTADRDRSRRASSQPQVSAAATNSQIGSVAKFSLPVWNLLTVTAVGGSTVALTGPWRVATPASDRSSSQYQ